jgi:hypothetical protein
VVAKVPACTQGGGPFSAGPQELHVIDPATATRRFIIGTSTCLIAGPPSPAGAICETESQATVLSWTAATIRSFAASGLGSAFLSPNGTMVAIAPGPDTLVQETNRTITGMQACGWIDDTHLFSGGDLQHQPRVAEVTTGNVAPIAAQGTCAGRIPGGL